MVSKFLNCGGLKMPIVGFGTWQSKDDELEAALEAALEAGYRHIDTAYIYENEAVIGRVLQRWLTTGKVKREELFITTKLPFFRVKPELVEETLKESLASLQLDYVDLYLVHFPCYVERTAEGMMEIKGITDQVAVWKKMEEQVKARRAKTIGVSNYSIKQIELILKNCSIKPANHQFELHLAHQQNEMVAFCKKNDISIVSYSSLGSPGSHNIEGLNEKRNVQLKLPKILENPIVLKLSKKYCKTPAQILLRQIIQRGICVIPKSTNAGRLRQNLDIFDFSLTAEDIAELESEDGEDLKEYLQRMLLLDYQSIRKIHSDK